MTITEMRVHMNCAGCECKIRKALKKLEGVDEIDVDMDMQKVTVIGWVDQKKVLKTVRKTGRKAELWEYDGYTQQYYHQQHHHQTYPVTYYNPQPSLPYNYYKHGYDGPGHGYYHAPAHSTIIDERTVAMFSDDNTNAYCSVM